MDRAILSANLRGKTTESEDLMHLWGSYGRGLRCDGCMLPISSSDVEYELRFRRDDVDLVITLHRECWEVWRSERLEL
jgi:hypothetical protein